MYVFADEVRGTDSVLGLEQSINLEEIENQVQTLQTEQSSGQDKIRDEHIITGGEN